MDDVRQEVLDFIKHFQNPGTIETFTEGCCFWFAYILDQRFRMTPCVHRIMYNQISGHFACEIDGTLYDITGAIEDRTNWEPWDDFYMSEPVYGEIVVRDCVLKRRDRDEDA